MGIAVSVHPVNMITYLDKHTAFLVSKRVVKSKVGKDQQNLSDCFLIAE